MNEDMDTKKKKPTHALFWTLLRQTAGYNESYKEVMKESLVWEASGHRTASLSELYEKHPEAYSRMIEQLKGDHRQRRQRYENEADTARKRVIAAIAKYLDRLGYTFRSRDDKVSYIRRIACRAANCPEFNRIPLSRLQAIYNLYCEWNRVEIRGNVELDNPPEKN